MKIDIRGQEMEVADEDVAVVRSALLKIEEAEKKRGSEVDERGAPELTGREREILTRYWRQRFSK